MQICSECKERRPWESVVEERGTVREGCDCGCCLR